MEENVPRQYEEDVIDLGVYFAILRKVWWKISLFSMGVGILTLVVMLQMRNVYQSKATITPVVDEGKQGPSLAMGALSSLGLGGGPTKVEDLEALFRSNDLTARVFRKYAHWAIVLGDRYDSSKGTLTPTLFDRLSGNEKGDRPPGDWDAIREAKKRLKIYTNKKAGILVISIESHSAEGSANMVRHYLEEAKDRLQEEAFERASRNKKFIEEQISRTVDPVTRDRLYSLYGQEVEREMMARNREQFGFKIIDTPRVPDRKAGPHRALISLLAAVLSFVVSPIFLAVWWRRRAAA